MGPIEIYRHEPLALSLILESRKLKDIRVMTCELTVALVENLQACALSIIDGDVDKINNNLRVIRSGLSVSHISQQINESSQYWLCRDYLIELFQSLFEINAFAAADSHVCQSLSPYLDDLVSEGIFLAIVDRFQFLTLELSKSTESNNVTGMISERYALSSLLYLVSSYSCPSLEETRRICTLSSSLEQGDMSTIPISMAILAALRPGALILANQHPRKNELSSNELKSIESLLNELKFQQQGLCFVFLLAVAVALSPQDQFIEYSVPRSSNHASDHDTKTCNLLSNAMPWLISQILTNVDRPYDPVASPPLLFTCASPSSAGALLTAFSSASSLFCARQSVSNSDCWSVTRYILNERLKEIVNKELQEFVCNIITRLSRVLNNLKAAADFALFEAAETSDSYNYVAMEHGNTSSRKHNDSMARTGSLPIEIFASFVALVFFGHQEQCHVFWDADSQVSTTFFRFLQMLTNTPHRRLQESAFSLIAALIHEPKAAARAFQAIHTGMLGTIPWNSLFSGIQYYVTAFRNLVEHGTCAPDATVDYDKIPHEQFGLEATNSEPPSNYKLKPLQQLDSSQTLISNAEVDLIVSLLRILRQVCLFDCSARRALLSGSSIDLLALLFQFLTCPVPLLLKAAIVDTIASFVAPQNGDSAIDVSPAVNSISGMQHHHIVERVWNYMESIALVPQVSLAACGLKQELDLREVSFKHFPLSIAFLQLLINLTPKQNYPSGQLFALVENLGAGTRSPGVLPYYSYMVHELLLKAESREYICPKELWVQWRLSLATIYDCLIDFDGICVHVSDKTSAATYKTIASHPAFYFLSEILDGKELLDGILRVISKGREVYSQSVRVLQENAKKIKSSAIFSFSSTDTPAAAKILQGDLSVENWDPSNSQFFSFPEYEDALLFAFKIIHKVLSMQSKFLGQILDNLAQHSIRNYASVASRRELDVHMSVRRSTIVDLCFFVRSPNQSVFIDELSILSVKILAKLSSSSSFAPVCSPNSLVHIICASELFDPIKSAYSQRMMSAVADDDPKSVRLAMLNLLVVNLKTRLVPTIAHALLGLTASSGKLDLYASSVTTNSLFSVIISMLLSNLDSIVAEEKALQLVYYLVSTEQTYPLCTFLKSKKYFIEIIKTRLVPERKINDKMLGSFAWIMLSTAVQIKTCKHKEYLNLLYTELYSTRKMCLIIDAIMGVSFDVSLPNDSIKSAYDAVNQSLPNGWPTKQDSQGCQVYDIKACRQIIGKILPLCNSYEENSEQPVIASILNILIEENKQRRINAAQLSAVHAWCDLLNVSLATNLNEFGDAREVADLIGVLVVYTCKHLRSSSVECKESFSKTLLFLVSVLRRVVAIDLINEQVLFDIIGTVMECIKAVESNIEIRGNLYAVLQLYFASASERRSTLVLLRTNGGEHLLSVLCLDCTTPSIWQTVAFSLLEDLLHLCQNDIRHWVYEFLMSKGYISHFVQMLKLLKPVLSRACSQVDLSTNDCLAIGVYESLMGVFQRIALNKQTCESLVGAGLIFVLTESLQKEACLEQKTRYNFILQSALDLLVSIVSTMSRATDKSHEYMMKAVAHFIQTLQGAFLLITKETLGILQTRASDLQNDMPLVRQTQQIAFLVEFVAKSKLTVCPEIVSSLLLIFIRYTRTEAHLVERTMLAICGHVVGYAFSLLYEETEKGQRLLSSPKRDYIIENKPLCYSEWFPDSKKTISAHATFIFDPDLAAAKDAYYSGSNRATMGLLALHIMQLIDYIKRQPEEQAVRQLETAMAVFYLHLRHYSSSKTGSLRIDASCVVPEIEAAVADISLQVSARSFLDFVCRASMDQVNKL